jgi:antitoxin component of RelBE/YafQ-DinJ toxin-antitoxin module
MVRTLNVTLDDDDFQRAEQVKDEIGLTWEGFIKEATRPIAKERGISQEDE